MTPEIQQWVRLMVSRYIANPGKVLEIGSFDVNGGVRHFFKNAEEYLGIDMREGRGVDLVLNAHDIKEKFDKDSFDTVVCLEMLEHDDKFWITMDNMKYVLKNEGFLIVSTPAFGFPLHRHPKDYYRFGEDFYREVLFASPMRLLEIALLNGPTMIAIGKKFIG